MHRLRLLALALVALAAGAAQCRKIASRKPPVEGDLVLPDGRVLKRVDLLDAFAQCALSAGRDFLARAERLDEAAALLESERTDGNRASAQQAWVSAMEVWERAEVLQYGPAAPLLAPGGQDLRSQIYAYPQVSRCLIEQGLVSRSYLDSFFTSSLVNMRGLYAAEYLFFYGGAENVCGPTASINATGAWAALGPDELAARKAAYARAAVSDVRRRAGDLVRAWDPQQGGFARELREAGTASKTFASQQAALNAVFDALFYVDVFTKDAKLGKPLGISGCAKPRCPEALESPWAHRSKEHVRQNLLGARALLFGCDQGGGGLGFEELLLAMGLEDLAGRLAAALAGALAAVDAIEEPDLEPALAADPASVGALHDAVKRVTDILKGELAVALELDLPRLVEGDND